MDILRFEQPASEWNEALPLGNGFIGAMVHGRTGKELIEINEDSLWSGTKMERRNPLSVKNIERIRNLFQKGEVEEAQKLAERSFFASSPHSKHYQPLGQIWLQFYGQEKITEYQRDLDIGCATAHMEYKAGGNKYAREAFSSFPARALVYHLTSESSGGLSFDLYLTRRDTRSGKTVSYLNSVECEENRIYLSGYNGDKESGIEYVMGVSVRAEGGTITQYGNRLAVENSTEVTLYVTGRTTYRSTNPRLWCEQQLEAAMKRTYAELKEEHTKDYRYYYDQMHLSFDGNPEYEGLTIKQRLENMRKGIADPGFAALYFNFGKYLMISSSRPGSLPANLQGIWAYEFEPSWGSKYTININLEMNYWMCEKTGLSDMHMPLMELMETMLPRAKETARMVYGMEGACAHHVTDIWGDCDPMDYNITSTVWPMGFVWLCLHIMEHFQYTGDAEFLKRHYPILKENAKFLLNYMYLDGSGYYATGPSVSPENIYITEEGQKAAVCISPAMDIQIIREFFTQYLKVCRILKDDIYEDSIKEHLDRLPADKIGRYGQLMEWQEDYEEDDPGHRHVAHLFALHPGNQINAFETPELVNAAKVTLERRLQYGGGHTGWSSAWITHFYARLLEAQKAYKILLKLFTELTLDNMLDNCPPFQIDGNFGGANAILELLVQDYEDRVVILPAVPEELSGGCLERLRLKCGAELYFKWKDRKVTELKINSQRGMKIKLHINQQIYLLDLAAGEKYYFKEEMD